MCTPIVVSEAQKKRIAAYAATFRQANDQPLRRR